MRNLKKMLMASFMVLALLFTGIVCYKNVVAEEAEKVVDVMFLHDTHSHLNEFATVEDGVTQTLGGFAKIKTLINAQKEENPDTLLLDAGDFSMGTLVQVVFEEEASEIRMLGELGMDVTTLGNHEFDYKASGLANMLNTAVASGDVLPKMVICNIDWDAMKEAGLTEDQQLLLDAFENYGVKDYIVVEKNGVKIAITGLFGENSEDCVASCPIIFAERVESVQRVVADIKEKEDVDMIVCVSHSGTGADESKSEDEILAKNVPELDLIISGHTHTKLDEPIVHGNTYIVSAAEYGKYLGNLSMRQKEDGRWEMISYGLIPVEESLKADEDTQEKVDKFMSLVDDKYLSLYAYTKDQVLATNDVAFVAQNDLSSVHTEHNLGSIIADAYAYAVEQAMGVDVDLAVAPSGTIRDSYALGDITVENVFNSFSLGIGKDGIPGYPLISIYLTGAELKTAAEIDASISDFSTTARLYTNGLYWSYNPNRMILNKVTDVYLYNNDGERVELEDDKLYHVVTDFYTSQMLGGVTDLSYGLLSVVPKFEDGTPIENYEDAIVVVDDKELKAWVAIAQYMESFEDTDGDGVANVPNTYATVEGRKVVEDSKNIIDLVKNPNKFFFIILAVIVLVIVIVVLVLVLIIKIIKKIYTKIRRKRRKSKYDI